MGFLENVKMIQMYFIREDARFSPKNPSPHQRGGKCFEKVF
jgi:hypothetical protein